MADVLSMSACVITRRTICGFAALILSPLPALWLSYINSYARHALARAYLRVYVCSRVRIGVRMWMSGRGYRQASPGEPYRRFLGERVEASPGSATTTGRGERRWGDTRDRARRGWRGEGRRKLQARGCPIRWRASRRQLLATPTRYATVIPWLPPLRLEKLESKSGSMWHVTRCCYWLHYILSNQFCPIFTFMYMYIRYN